MTFLTFLRRLASAIKGAVLIFKHGGVCTASIVTSSYSNMLEGKSVLVTGGSSGIGFAIACKCINSGATVVITGRNEIKLREAVESINSPKCQYLVWDISKVKDCHKQINKCKELMGGEIDVLVNNAGVAPSKFFGDIDELEWDRIYDTNLKGNYFLTQEIVKQWRCLQYSGYKKILNISSQGGFVGATYPYRMTKWDVRGLTEGLGKLLVEDKIIVNGASLLANEIEKWYCTWCCKNIYAKVLFAAREEYLY